jgi:Fur family peroxide stress response transcriptional regulator
MAGKKHSKKRDVILELLQSTTSHPSARWIYEELRDRIPGLSLATVYRNINLFLKEGLVYSVGVVNGEERFDGYVTPHPHLVCSHCGSVIDIPTPDKEMVNLIAEKEQAARLFPPGFSIDYRKMVFYGVCSACNNKQTTGASR